MAGGVKGAGHTRRNFPALLLMVAGADPRLADRRLVLSANLYPCTMRSRDSLGGSFYTSLAVPYRSRISLRFTAHHQGCACEIPLLGGCGRDNRAYPLGFISSRY